MPARGATTGAPAVPARGATPGTSAVPVLAATPGAPAVLVRAASPGVPVLAATPGAPAVPVLAATPGAPAVPVLAATPGAPAVPVLAATPGAAAVAGSAPGGAAMSVSGLAAAIRRRPSLRAWPGPMLAAGIAACLIALGLWLAYLRQHPPHLGVPLDLRIYRYGGLIAGHVRPWYDPRRGSPLYDWPGYQKLKFTYSPFAALIFTALTVPTSTQLLAGSEAVSILALVAAVWFTLGGLGYKPGAARAGLTLLATALAMSLEPVQRTLALGQIELVLMALIIWDMCQSDRRWWKGVGVGVAAGIKLVPLIFVVYLLLTRRFRQAAVALGTFAATVAVGFLVMPSDSRAYWFGRVFADGSRTGFVGFGGNQSLRGLITRLAGSVAGGQPAWLAVAAVTLVTGLLCAAAVDRAGHRVLGVLGCALTGLLVSPISWDHHWVWAVPAIVAVVAYGARASGALRWACFGIAIATLASFGAWPVSLWDEPPSQANYHFGLIWAPPDPNPIYRGLGDRRWYPVYHWHGLELVIGNLYALTGLVLLAVLTVAAIRITTTAAHGVRDAPGQAAPSGARLAQ